MADAVRESERRPLFVARQARPLAATAGPVILFTAGGVRFAIEASEVQEIRDGDERTANRKLKGAESIDFALRVGLGEGILERYVVLKPGECSLGVTEVERMTTLPKVAPLPGLFRGAERQWYRGLLLLENEVVPLVRTEYWRKAAARAAGLEAAHE
jgi:chemotaxis signal transduction protein